MTRMMEISYWRVVEGREADVVTGANAFKAFCAKNLDATFSWGYVTTGKYVDYCYCSVLWNNCEAYGKWQDTYQSNKEYQAWVASVWVKAGPPDYMVDRQLIHLVD
jgi:hypothetical protein